MSLPASWRVARDSRRDFVAFMLLLGGGVVAVVALTHSSPLPRPRLWRLVDQLAEARRVEQKVDLIDPEVLHLEPGAITPPSGWTSLPGEVANFTVPSPRPIHLRVDVPIAGGRDYVVKVTARDAVGNLRVLVQHAPNLEQPEPGWHRATEERAGVCVRFDWREDTPPDEKVLPVVIESEATTQVVIESFTVREAGARDPSIVEAAPGVALHGLVDRPVEGKQAVSRPSPPSAVAALGRRRNLRMDAGAAAAGGADLRHGHRAARRRDCYAVGDAGRIETRAGWTQAWKGAPGATWREAKVTIPRDAKAIRLATQGPQVAAWGNPILRDPPQGKKHVLLITLDAVRPDHLGSYGYSRATSPFLDGLAARGERFTDVTAQRSHTWASTTSLLTGQFPQTNGVLARGERPHRGLYGLGRRSPKPATPPCASARPICHADNCPASTTSRSPTTTPT